MITENRISLENIAIKFELTEKENEDVKGAITGYCKGGNKFENFGLIFANLFKGAVGLSDWQVGVRVLESKIEGVYRKEVAIFLLAHCLNQQIWTNYEQSVPAYGPLAAPIDLNDWKKCDMGSWTIDYALEQYNCTFSTNQRA